MPKTNKGVHHWTWPWARAAPPAPALLPPLARARLPCSADWAPVKLLGVEIPLALKLAWGATLPLRPRGGCEYGKYGKGRHNAPESVARCGVRDRGGSLSIHTRDRRATACQFRHEQAQ